MPKQPAPTPASTHWSVLIEQFKTEVHNRAAEVDPEQEHHWLGLTVGWAIAKGLSPEEANAFAVYIRYSTDLG